MKLLPNQNEIGLAELQKTSQVRETVLNGVGCPVFTLPDRVLASALLPEGNGKVVFYGAESIDDALIISVSAFEHYVRSTLQFKNGSAGIWLRVDTVSALELIASLGGPSRRRHFRGFIANVLMLPEPVGIFTPCRAVWESEVSAIEEVTEDYCPFSGLSQKLKGDAPSALELASHTSAFLQRTAERGKAAALQHGGAVPELEVNGACPADLFFRCASALKSLGAIDAAIDFCTSAVRFDHPKARELLNRIQSEASKPLRDAYPEVFDQILRGDRMRALTVLRQLAETRNDALPVLAYCLRQTNSSEEGLNVCTRSLAINRNQPDVLSHRWSYLTELHRDAEALATAREHILRFPQDEGATVNALDSALLLGRADDARVLLARCAAFSSNLELTLRQYFKTYEQLGNWDGLVEEYERTLPLLHAPSAETLCRYGEALIELERFDECFAAFERALAIEPGNAKVILGFARALARCDREQEAEALLQTGLGDRNRADIDADRLFIITLLAEIRRRTGRPAEALEIFSNYVAGDLVEMSSFAGPIPALEYAEALLALGRTADAAAVTAKLKSIFPQDPLVDELAGICAAG